MTSVCVKNVGTSPEKLPPASHSRKSSKTSVMSLESQPVDPQLEDPVDFEFLLEDPVTMLTADELFSDGKLVPLKFSSGTNPEEKPMVPAVNTVLEKPCRRLEMEIDPYLFSPRAPRCTVRWRELLGLKRLNKTPEEASPPSSSSSRLSSSTPNPKTSSFRQFLNRSSKSTTASPPQAMIKDSDISESSTSISSSRLSLSSSSSSGHELDDPRRHDETTESSNDTRALTVTADSPRLNASGKIVFHGLERSSSSPGNFTGGPRMKQHHGMPRSQSAHVRITPVLNVPVSSLRGGPKSGLFFGQLFTSSTSANRAQLQSSNTAKNRTNRTRLEPTSET
ncbi:BnaC05g40370D [Brassica napus]|uniref:BnaC05g40370D protein n=1 Tax=Brassica napus TaxID=3708 RepID=A0A078GEP2_BRANA|nr:BnaC05g40370D [Brassica napus]